MTLVKFPRRAGQGQRATFVLPAPLFDRQGRQLRVAAPGTTCWVIGVYEWKPGPGSVRSKRVEVHLGGRERFDVERVAIRMDGE